MISFFPKRDRMNKHAREQNGTTPGMTQHKEWFKTITRVVEIIRLQSFKTPKGNEAL